MSKPPSVIRRAKGITLIEVAIAMAIVSIALLGSYGLLVNVQGTQVGNTEVAEAQQESRIVLERIAREVRESSLNKIWPTSLGAMESDYIIFYSARDSNRVFNTDPNGLPLWQRAIAYELDQDSGELRRHQLFMSDPPSIVYDSYEFEVLSRNFERLAFSQFGNTINISARTFVDRTGKLGNVARSYAEFDTAVELRN